MRSKLLRAAVVTISIVALFKAGGVNAQTLLSTDIISTPGPDRVRNVAAGNGFVVLVGSVGGAIDGTTDGFIQKRNVNGVVEWTRLFGTSAEDAIEDAAVDADGNIYVTGWTKGVLAGAIDTDGAAEDGFVAKYNTEGTLQWETPLYLSGYLIPGHIALATGGSANEVIVAGYTNALFAAGGVNNGPNNGPSFLGFFNKETGAQRDLRPYTELTVGHQPGSLKFGGIAVDPSGDIYLLGGFNTGTWQGGMRLMRLTAAGVPVWAAPVDLGGPLGGNPGGLALMPDGRVVVAGTTKGGLIVIGNAVDVTVRAINPDGTVSWERTVQIPGDEVGLDVVAQQNGNLLLVGQIDGSVHGYFRELGVWSYYANGQLAFESRLVVDVPPGEPTHRHLGAAAAVVGGSLYIGGSLRSLGLDDAFLAVVSVPTPEPVLTLPLSVTQTGSLSRTPVEFSATATDDLDPFVAVDCTPASGDGFLFGTTPVTCSATDSDGHTTMGSFNVTITISDVIAQGPPGARGIQGERGLPGEKGDKGEKGDLGLQGIPGAKGDPGQAAGQGVENIKLVVSDQEAILPIPSTRSGTIVYQLYPDVEQALVTLSSYTDDSYGNRVILIRNMSGTRPVNLLSSNGDPLFSSRYEISQGTSIGPNEEISMVAAPEAGVWFVSELGKRGPEGLQGPKGDRGFQGLQGMKGATGNDGQQGLQGDKGEQGTPGLPGAKGDKGETGVRGLQGLQGIQGVKGDKGDKGDPGTQGTQGTQGLPGSPGLTGPEGVVPRNARGAYNFANVFGFVAETSQLLPSADPPESDPGIRFMWYPGKAAFRAGEVTRQEWNKGNIGNHSAALGLNTVASGDFSFAAGNGAKAHGTAAFAAGFRTDASGQYSVALGTYAEAADGGFAFSDQVARTAAERRAFGTVSAGENQFVVRASGGVEFYSGPMTPNGSRPDLVMGVRLAPFAGAWSNLSDARRKENFRDLDGEAVLRGLASIPVREWNYIAQGAGIRHVGPTAQDFRGVFGLGEDDEHISTIDPDGISLRAIQALDLRSAATRDAVVRLQEENVALRERLTQLEKAFAGLLNR